MAWGSAQIVLNGMGGGEKHLKLTSIVFQTLFAPIDVAKVTAPPFPNGCPAHTATDSVKGQRQLNLILSYLSGAPRATCDAHCVRARVRVRACVR